MEIKYGYADPLQQQFFPSTLPGLAAILRTNKISRMRVKRIANRERTLSLVRTGLGRRCLCITPRDPTFYETVIAGYFT